MVYSVSTWNYSALLKDGLPFEQMLDDIAQHELGVELWLATTTEEQRGVFKERYTDAFAHLSCHTAMANVYDGSTLKAEIDFCSAIGATTLVVHPISLGIDSHTFSYAYGTKIDAAVLKTIDGFLDHASRAGVVLALENGPRDVLDQVADHVGAPYPATPLGICVDTGHAAIHHAQNPHYLVDLITRFHSWIVQLHIHDNTGASDDHMVPGTASIAWQDVSNALGDLKERVPWVFELKSGSEPIKDIQESIRFVSTL